MITIRPSDIIMNAIYSAALIAAFAGFLAGCSPSPSPDIAEQALRRQIESESKGQIALVGFKKTDGQKFEEMGVQGYKLDFEADIEFGASGVWRCQDHLTYGHAGLTWVLKPASQSVMGQVADSTAGGIPVTRATRAKIGGQMTGEKKESGWVFSVGETRILAQSETSATAPAATEADSFAAEAEKKERQQIGKNPEAVKLIDFKKIDCRKTDVNGVQGYRLEFEMEIEMLVDEVMDSQEIKAGERVKIAAHLNGTKGENGWVLVPMKPSDARVLAHTPGVKPKASPEESRKLCIQNLVEIDAAKQQWALELNKGPKDKPASADLLPFLGRGANAVFPVCPAGGTYSINAIDASPTCSIPGHALQ
jgi:hypothetical protein